MVSIALNPSSRNYYATLGKLLIQKKPEVARELISAYPPSDPIEKDFTKLPTLFIHFCQLQHLEPDSNRGALYKSYKIDQRRLFIAAMAIMYHPFTRNLVTSISQTIGQHKSDTAKMIKEVQTRYRAYDDFRSEVDQIVEQLKEGV